MGLFKSKPCEGKADVTKAWPLRVRLVVIIVIVSGFGLIVSSTAVNAIMREVVYDQVDKDLEIAARGWALNENLEGQSVNRHLPSDYGVIKIPVSGTVQFINLSPTSIPDIGELIVGAPPMTVKSDSVGSSSYTEQVGSETSDSGAQSNESSTVMWRAMATRVNGGVIVIAKQVTRENAQLNGLAWLQVLISTVVLCVIALVSALVIRRSLRPLREVEQTAAAIAAGDLSKRVPRWPENTEVGQLSSALNIMLGQLEDSVESSREKEEQMRRFVGDASHELRTPLTSLRGYTELYRSGATNDVDLVLEKVDAESKRMSLLVEDLLALTRAEGNRLEMRKVDVLELSLAVCSTAKAAFQGRTVEVRTLADSVPVVQGDPDRLHQVLLNLVSNGLSHGGPQASVTIQVRNDADHVYVDVKDDGKGMPAEVSAHIFERFYRADKSRTRDTGGSGLGLAITKSLVEQHGGTISVQSQPGEGSTFTVQLPAA